MSEWLTNKEEIIEHWKQCNAEPTDEEIESIMEYHKFIGINHDTYEGARLMAKLIVMGRKDEDREILRDLYSIIAYDVEVPFPTK